MHLQSNREFPKYRRLLIVLIANLIIAPFLKGMIGSLIASLLFFYAIVVVIRSLALPEVFFKSYLAIALVALGLEVAGNNGWIASSGTTFIFLAQGIYASYLGVSITLIFRELYTTSRITIDVIQGGICIYLMLGLIWSLFYGMTATLDGNAFSTPLVLEKGYTKIIYFSFTTLTTVGYGDILPMSDVAQVLSNVEAIVGQLYPTIFMAMLVGGYLSQNNAPASGEDHNRE